MQVGAQLPYTDDDLLFARQMGLKYIDTAPATGLGLEDDGAWHADALQRVREHVESFGLQLAAMHLPLSSAGIEHQVWPHILLGTPERERDIERVCRSIVAAARAGIPLLLYNLAVLPVLRTGRSLGRGDVHYSHFDVAELQDEAPLAGKALAADLAWERISYFVERVVPVAEEYGVRLGCHQHDPGLPPGRTYRGVERVLGSIEGVRRFLSLHSSPYHGLNFCQGTIAEMCTSPEQVYEAIREFGSQGRIFWVHFRNIRGGLGRFDEVFPDEGDIDMVRAMRTYHQVGYDGVFIPDHVPHSDLDSAYGHRAHAYCYGYIRGLIQCVQNER